MEEKFHFHDLEVLKEVAREFSKLLVDDYQFKSCQPHRPNHADFKYVSVEKSKVQFCIHLSKMQGIDLKIYVANAQTEIGVLSLLSTAFGRFSTEKKKFLQSRHDKSMEFTQYSEQYYLSRLLTDLEFIKSEFPEFINGQIPENVPIRG